MWRRGLLSGYTMGVRISGATVERRIESIRCAIQPDGSTIEYPEPLLYKGVVFRPHDPALIIVQRTILA